MCRSGFISLNVLLFFNLLCICIIIIIISYMYLQMNMDQVDSGIKMLVEAIAEAQSSATNGSPQCTGITSTPLRQSVPTAHSLETSITMSPAPVLGNVSAGEARENGNEESGGDSSINSGYNGDTSALPGDFNSPAKSNCQPGINIILFCLLYGHVA